jgi:hypothetical protein
MKTDVSTAKGSKSSKPFEVVKVGSISIPIYVHTNIIPQGDQESGAILYENLPGAKRS